MSQEIIARLQYLEGLIQEREDELESAKTEVKEAREQFDVAVSDLREFIKKLSQPALPFEEQKKEGDSQS